MVPLFNGIVSLYWQMYICSQVTSFRDGCLVVVYCLLPKAFGKEDGDQLTALNFENIFLLFIITIFVFIHTLFLYLLGNVTSVISVIVICVYYCC